MHIRISKLHTERLLLKPLEAEDASQIQVLHPRWEIVRYIVSSVPWPCPDSGAKNYISNVAPPDMEKGTAWIWAARLHEAPDALIGLIHLYGTEDNNHGFQLTPEYQGRGLIREANSVATDYWFNMLSKMVLRVPEASLNIHSIRISDSSGMRLIKAGKKEYISDLLDSELWEVMRDEQNARQVG